MKQLVFSSWHFMRLLRLVVGISFVVTGFVQHDGVAVAFGSFFFLQALLKNILLQKKKRLWLFKGNLIPLKYSFLNSFMGNAKKALPFCLILYQ